MVGTYLEGGRGILRKSVILSRKSRAKCHLPTDFPEKLSVAFAEPRVEDEFAWKEEMCRRVW